MVRNLRAEAVAPGSRGGGDSGRPRGGSRGTKKAVDDAIYEAEASNLGSAHRDFPIGAAYDLSVLDRPLSRDELSQLVLRAKELAKDPEAIRSVRQVEVPSGGF